MVALGHCAQVVYGHQCWEPHFGDLVCLVADPDFVVEYYDFSLLLGE